MINNIYLNISIKIKTLARLLSFYIYIYIYYWFFIGVTTFLDRLWLEHTQNKNTFGEKAIRLLQTVFQFE